MWQALEQRLGWGKMTPDTSHWGRDKQGWAGLGLGLGWVVGLFFFGAWG